MIDITSLIGNYAFPIVACICMAYYVKYTNDKFDEQLNNQAEKHQAEVNHLSDVIANNTTVLEKILTKLGDD